MRWAVAIRAWGRRHPQIVDTAIGVALVVPPGIAMLAGWHGERAHTGGPGDLVAVVTALVMLACRRLWPALLILAGTAVSAGYLIATGQRQPLLAGAGVIVTVTFIVRADRRR